MALGAFNAHSPDVSDSVLFLLLSNYPIPFSYNTYYFLESNCITETDHLTVKSSQNLSELVKFTSKNKQQKLLEVVKIVNIFTLIRLVKQLNQVRQLNCTDCNIFVNWLRQFKLSKWLIQLKYAVFSFFFVDYSFTSVKKTSLNYTAFGSLLNPENVFCLLQPITLTFTRPLKTTFLLLRR